MDEVERLIRTIFLLHGETRKIPLTLEGKRIYDYNEDYIMQKLLYRYELIEHITKRGYTQEQAEKMIAECWLRGIINMVSMDPQPPKKDRDIFIMANEEYWVEEEEGLLSDYVREEIVEREIREYVLDHTLNEHDEHEEKIREVYYEHNRKVLRRETLIHGLMKRGYTLEQAEKLLEEYTTAEIPEEEKRNWDEADKIFRRPEYKPLRYHKLYVDLKLTGEKNERGMYKSIFTEIPDSFEIMQYEEWELREYGDILLLRLDGVFIHGTRKVPFKTIKRILKDAEKQGRKTLTKRELKERIMEECGATEEEADVAIHAAEATFKIRTMDPTLRELWNLEPFKEVEYYWSGTTLWYPPLTLQDRAFNPIRRIFTQAEKDGKEWLTRRELVEKAYEIYREEYYAYSPVPRVVTRELAEDLVEDAEELLLIDSKQENGETLYRLNHQIVNQLKKIYY
ncbi:MAG: hypothetical protein ACTSRF_06640 [Candidatus Freyarchaeota archaeon]|nr:hypothetical protein [Deltaproteobacteria bacterium]